MMVTFAPENAPELKFTVSWLGDAKFYIVTGKFVFLPREFSLVCSCIVTIAGLVDSTESMGDFFLFNLL